MTGSAERGSPDRLFVGGGELGTAMAATDWAQTPLGPPESWSAELRSVVRVLLTSRFSMWMAWGPELTMFYNDAYRRDTLRAKHPWALGRPAAQVWAEIWDDIGPRIESVLATGVATWDEDLLLFLERSSYPEETYHTFSYSPLGESGRVVGMLCVVTENTDRVLSERRMGTLRDLATALAPGGTQADVLAAVSAQLGANPRDLPFTATYLFDDGGAGLSCTSGVEPGSPAAPERISDGDADRWWRLDRLRGGQSVLLDLGTRFDRLPAGAWTRPPTQAIALPLAGQSEAGTRGFLVAGLSPVRAFDERYRGFAELLAGQIAASLAAAGAYEVERRRAEALAELDRAKTEFFTGISHEFRTPLTLIRGPVQDLLAAGESGDGLDPERMRAELVSVDRNAGRLGRLVDNLLDFTRVQAGRAQARFAPTDLAAVTADLASMFRAAIERAGLSFTVKAPPLAEPVWVDRQMWEKVVLNLLSNALKYTLRGRITVTVRGDADAAVLEVADTGAGIPADELPRLFERFHRVPGSRGRSVEGSGIGLALVHELVELHGGHVTVESVVGAGTTSTVRVPLGSAHLPAGQGAEQTVDLSAAAARAAAPYLAEALGWLAPIDGDDTVDDAGLAEVSGEAVPAAGSVRVAGDGGYEEDRAGSVRASVLVVDDNTDMRAYLTRLFASRYAVQAASDGQAALEAIRSEPPDLVVTDVMMPRLDGFGLLAALRADPHTATLPVIVLSARAGQEAAIEGLAAGADEYLIKPFTAAELLARVRSVLTLAQVRRQEANWRGALLNALRDGLFVVNGAGQVVEINDGFAEIFGYGTDGLPYELPHPWWPDPDTDPDAYARVMAAMDALQTTGRGRHLLALRHRDGRRLWVEISADTVPDPDGPGPPMLIGVARDVTAAHRAAQRDRLLAEAGQILADADERGGGVVGRLQQVADLAAAVFDDGVLVARTAADGRMPPVVAAHPHQPELAAAILELGPYRIPAALVETYRRGRAFVLDPTPPDLLREALGDDAYAARAHIGLGATLVAPLAVRGRLLGLLIVICPGGHPPRHPVGHVGRRPPTLRQEPVTAGAAGSEPAGVEPTGRFDQADVEVAQELARRIAVALEAERVATREHQLNAASAALAAAATVPEAAAALAHAVRDALEATGVVVYTARSDEPRRLHLEHDLGFPEGFAAGTAAGDGAREWVCTEVVRTGEPVWSDDARAGDERYPPVIETEPMTPGSPVKAVAALPLQLGGRMLGVLMATFATPREFTPADRGFATTLVGQAAQAFERAALTDARWETARTLQQHLLPAAPPSVNQVEVATRYLPAVHDVAAGGDWYDVIRLDEQRTAVVVGDVVGQGATAAAVMGQLRSGLALALTNLGPDVDPAVALAQLNRYTARVPGARGSTAVCLIVDTENRQIRWARAGHPPPLLIPHEGTLRYLDAAAGPLLGAFRADTADGDGAVALYEQAVTDFSPGDTVVLYTDGLVERRGEIIDDGMDRVAAAVHEVPGADPARLVARLFAAAVPDGHAHDDIAVLAARALPAPLRQRRPADPRELAAVRRTVAGWAALAALDKDLVDDLQLALGEAVANTVEHAYPSDHDGEVEYTLRRCDGGASVQATVTDHGTWRPPPADRGYRGRGLELIRALAPDLTVEHDARGPDGRGTTVRFTLTAPQTDTDAAASVPARDMVAPPGPPLAEGQPASLQVQAERDRLHLALHGEIDLPAVQAVRADLLAHLDADPATPMVLDLHRTSYLSSAGIGLLLDLAEHARAGGRRLEIEHDTTGPVARVLTLAGLCPTLTNPPQPAAGPGDHREQPGNRSPGSGSADVPTTSR
ncbi:SpoIIE family protein phosphatase [Pseudonocardia acidicola]|uniref:histidine kinase n=1 Tax=Pseudonocardia acidicola TaxID=2724939 RepID=A0ABX1SA47_9PSEU|nr:SpoIIE family protein phosphatase [Pseudonocardia acidicola]NMH98439.1 SpoIIE family protein phosphatase [Pseudonocardia acidicola]